MPEATKIMEVDRGKTISNVVYYFTVQMFLKNPKIKLFLKISLSTSVREPCSWQV